METLNIGVKNAIQFISVVQDAYDKKRTYLEQRWSHEYDCFLLEWKQAQKSCENKLHKEVVLNDCPSDELLPEDEEALALADSLLEKARIMRRQKVVPRKKLDLVKNHLKTEALNCHNSTNTNSTIKPLCKINKKDWKLIEKVLPRSKSSTVPVSQISSPLLRSKSGCSLSVPKKDIVLSNTNNKLSVTTKKSNTSVIAKNGNKKLREPCSAIISSSALSSFKSLHIDHRLSVDKQKEVATAHNSFNSDSTHEQAVKISEELPTLKTFTKVLKSKLHARGYHLTKSGSWYPYAAARTQDYLSRGLPCDSFKSFSKAYHLIHSIQETMLWIDLLCIIGKEILPSILHVNKNDLNGMRLRSYFKSIFQDGSQRTPILHPNQ